MTKVKSCLLCENYMVHHSECEHCEDWDNFRISESGKALREEIYGDGYQDGHRDGYDKGYDDAQRPQGEWIDEGQYAEGYSEHAYACKKCGYHIIENPNMIYENRFCKYCGADMRKAEE